MIPEQDLYRYDIFVSDLGFLTENNDMFFADIEEECF